MKVLLVDDENHILEYLKHLIRWSDFGYDTVLTATSGQAASQLLQAEKPALLITDIRMPEVSGLDLARLVTTNKLATQVVILSGYSEFDYAQQALRYGVVDYLLKPVLQPDLEKVVRHVAQLRQENFDLSMECRRRSRSGRRSVGGTVGASAWTCSGTTARRDL